MTVRLARMLALASSLFLVAGLMVVGSEQFDGLAHASDGPSIESVSPESGTAAGGMSIEITGRGFGTNESEVTVSIGGAAATVHRVTDTKIFVSAPTNQTPGLKDVSVSLDGGVPVVLEDSFTFSDGTFGDFRVQDFATGTRNFNFVLRGYVFKPSRQISVKGIWGGSGENCTGFEAFIASAEVNEADIDEEATTNTPGIKVLDILSENHDGVDHVAKVDWRLFTQNTPEYQDFSRPFTLSPDEYYFVGQQRTAGDSNCHFAAENLDFENLILGSAIIDEWYPRDNSQYVPGGINMTNFRDNTDTARILVGFRYETESVLAAFNDAKTDAVRQSDTSVLVSAELSSTGEPGEDGETTLYFERATNDTFTSEVALLPATPPDLKGPGSDIPVARSFTGLEGNQTYFYRPVAINEAGRVDGQSQSFRINDMTAGFDVSTNIENVGSASGSVTPEVRTVLEGEATTFVATPRDSSSVSATTTCGGGVTSGGNTFTVSNVTAACGVTFTFSEAAETPPAPAPPAAPGRQRITAEPTPPPAPSASVAVPGRTTPAVPTPSLAPLTGPVLRGAVLPTPPQRPVARVGNRNVPVTTQVNSPGRLDVQAGSVSLGVSVAQSAGGVRQQANGATELDVRSGGQSTLQGGGVLAGSTVQVFLPLSGNNSQQLSEMEADTEGNFSGDAVFASPRTEAPLPIGRQMLQIVSLDESGERLVMEMAVVIGQPPPAPEFDRSVDALPQLSPGLSIATEAGLPVAVQVRAETDNRQAVIEADGWTMTIGVAGDDASVDETPEGGASITFVRDELAAVSGSGFMPGTRVDVWLFSEPTLLKTVTIDDNGDFVGEVSPDAHVVAVGEHTLQLQGVGSDGYIRSANLGVLVQDAGADAATTPEVVTSLAWWFWIIALLSLLIVVVIASWLYRRAQSTT